MQLTLDRSYSQTVIPEANVCWVLRLFASAEFLASVEDRKIQCPVTLAQHRINFGFQADFYHTYDHTK